MGSIRNKKQSIGIIGSDDEQTHTSYCERCEKLGFLSVLQDRVYPPYEPIPSDHDLWKQCHRCGEVFPIYEVKKESRLTDFVETSDNPFED